MNFWEFLAFGIVSLVLLVDGQEVTSDGCFQRWRNQELSCATAFQRLAGVSETQCLDACRQNFQCQSINYKTQQSQCEFFTVTGSSGAGAGQGFGAFNGRSRQRQKRDKSSGGRSRRNHGGGYYRPQPPPPPPPPRNQCGYGPRLMACAGVNYFRPTGRCGGVSPTVPTPAPTVAPLPPGAVCPPGKVPRFLKLDGISLQGAHEFSFNSNGLQQCIDACIANKLPTGQDAGCISFDFNQATMQCAITARALAPKGTGSPQANLQSSYYEKICVDGNLVRNCGNIFPQFPQKILVGFAQNVINVNSIQDCLQACLEAQTRFGVTCRSGMYYYKESQLNCILNSEDRNTHPELFIEEPQDTVTYFETGCQVTPGGRVMANPSIIATRQTEWGVWSVCGTERTKARYRNCRTSNPNTCERGEEKCDSRTEADTGSVSTPCNALLKPDGSKDCTRPGRKFADGKLQECKPTDC